MHRKEVELFTFLQTLFVTETENRFVTVCKVHKIKLIVYFKQLNK